MLLGQHPPPFGKSMPPGLVGQILKKKAVVKKKHNLKEAKFWYFEKNTQNINSLFVDAWKLKQKEHPPQKKSIGTKKHTHLHSLKLTAKAPENRAELPQKETIVFQPSIFRCENVSFREGNPFFEEWHGQNQAPAFSDLGGKEGARGKHAFRWRRSSEMWSEWKGWNWYHDYHQSIESHQMYLVGGFSPTHLNNMRKSNWIEFPQGSGWK